MNQKITLQDIINSVAQKHGMDKKDAELFVKGIFDLIEEALSTESYVKIKGLGTFKLTEVDSRESVDVNTGVRIEIQGHRKVTFLPDASLKELINKPFSHFETVLLNDDVVIEDEIEATPLADINEEKDSVELDEIEAMLTPTVEKEEIDAEELVCDDEKIVTINEPAEAEIELPKATEQEDGIPQVTEEPIEIEKVEIETIVLPESEEKRQAAEEPQEPQEPQEELKEKKQEEEQAQEPKLEVAEPTSKNHVPLFIVLILLLIAGVIYHLSARKDTTPKSIEPTTSVRVEEENIEDSLKISTELNEAAEETPIDSSMVATAAQPIVKESIAKSSNDSSSVKYAIVGTQAEYAIKPGESLSAVARKFYGRTESWIYIVEHNKAIITNPDNVPINTTIKIPELRPIE